MSSIKVLVLGPSAKKGDLVLNYVNVESSSDFDPMLAESYQKTEIIDNNTLCLEVSTTHGQDNFLGAADVLISQAELYILVVDLDAPQYVEVVGLIHKISTSLDSRAMVKTPKIPLVICAMVPEKNPEQECSATLVAALTKNWQFPLLKYDKNRSQAKDVFNFALKKYAQIKRLEAKAETSNLLNRIKENTENLEEIKLYHSSDATIRSLSQAMVTNTKVKQIDFVFNDFTVRGLQRLVKMLKDNACIAGLTLTNTKFLTDVKSQALFAELSPYFPTMLIQAQPTMTPQNMSNSFPFQASKSLLKMNAIVVGDRDVDKKHLLTGDCQQILMVDGEKVQLNLSDKSEQDEFMLQLSFHQIEVFVIVYSSELPKSIENVKDKWLTMLRFQCPDTPIVLINMRRKQDNAYVQGSELAKAIKADAYYEYRDLSSNECQKAYSVIAHSGMKIYAINASHAMSTERFVAERNARPASNQPPNKGKEKQAPDYKHKVSCLVVGDYVGGRVKLCYMITAGDRFESEYGLYLPSSFDAATFAYWMTGERIKVSLNHDSATQDYKNLSKVIYPRNDVFILTYSATSRESFESISSHWQPLIRSVCPDNPVFLVATDTEVREDKRQLRKLGLSQSQLVTTSEGQSLATKLKAHGFFECATNSPNAVCDMFEKVVRAGITHQLKPLSVPPAQRRFKFGFR